LNINKIAFIVGTLSRGGIERQLYYMADNLIKIGYDINVLCLTEDEFWERKLIDLGVKIHHIENYSFKFLKLNKIYKIIKDQKYDLLYSTHFYTNIAAAIVGTILKIPSVTSVRNDYFFEEKGLGKIMTFFSLSFSSITIANSRAAIINGQRRIKNHNWNLLYNCVDTNKFIRKKQKINESLAIEKNIKILIVARLTKEKRVDFFLKLIHDLKRKFGNEKKIISYIAGSGRKNENLMHDLVQMSKNFSLEDEMIFLGDVNDMPKLYNNSDILVLTSEHEGLPNCILEAMASGLPVIANNVGGVSELIINNVTGFLIEPFDKNDFLNKLKLLINDKKLRKRMGASGRIRVKKHFSIEKNIKKLTLVFKNLQIS